MVILNFRPVLCTGRAGSLGLGKWPEGREARTNSWKLAGKTWGIWARTCHCGLCYIDSPKYILLVMIQSVSIPWEQTKLWPGESARMGAEKQEETILRLNIWVWTRYKGKTENWQQLNQALNTPRKSPVYESPQRWFLPFIHLDYMIPEQKDNSRVESFQVAVTLVLCQVYYSLLTKLQLVFTT